MEGEWYFAPTAFIGDGTESDYSNEVSATIKPKAPKVNTVTQIAIAKPVTVIVGLFQSDKRELKMRVGYN